MPPSRIAFALADVIAEIERTMSKDWPYRFRSMRLVLDGHTFDEVASNLKDRFGLPSRQYLHFLGSECDTMMVQNMLICRLPENVDGGSG